MSRSHFSSLTGRASTSRRVLVLAFNSCTRLLSPLYTTRYPTDQAPGCPDFDISTLKLSRLFSAIQTRSDQVKDHHQARGKGLSILPYHELLRIKPEKLWTFLFCQSICLTPILTLYSMSTASNDVLSWTNQDPRESVLFNSWGVLYRFQVRVIHQHCFFNTSIVFTDGSEPQRAERNNSMALHSAQQGRPSCKTRVGCQWWTRPHRHWKSKFSSRSDATDCN